MRIRWLVGLLALAPPPLHADVEVRLAGNRVSLHAVSAPVAEILESLARHTGMRLTYDAPPPRQLLTATVEDRSPAEAVLSVLEGLGLNYALVMDRSGTKVDQLLILGATSATAAALPGRPLPPTQAHRPPAPEQQVLEDFADEEGADDVLEGMDELGQPEVEPTQPSPAPAPAAAPSIVPPAPEYPNSPFSPRLPLPTPPPVPSPQPTPPRVGNQ